ncbi:MAG: kinase [Alphaproteobacteria bacterium]|nr:kinase [Alphaproteobacteria bacterium]
MIISRTPFRVSLFGGGSDYPTWFRQHGGAVLGFSINKYCYISVRELPPFFEHKHRIVYGRTELVSSLEEIQHPAVRAVLSEMGVRKGLEMHHDGDLPARSGLGSSSSFTVGLLNALHAAKGEMVSKKALADQAIHIEQNVIEENVGSQDQVWAAYGGLNRIDFHRDNSFDVTPLILSPERRAEFRDSILFFFTGFSRIASLVAGEKIKNMEHRQSHLMRIMSMVGDAVEVLRDQNKPIRLLGEMLHESWMLKRELADQVSNPAIDEIYQNARDAGAIGGKLLGAGGGGFMVFIVEKHNRERVRERLRKLIGANIDIDMSGSKIVVYEPQGLEYC